MQPYQLASQTMQDKRASIVGFPKKVGKMGLQVAGAIAGAPLIAKALPFLAGGVSAEAAIKGLTALNPNFGKFIDKALKKGTPFNEIKSFLSEKFTEAEATAPKSLFEKILGDTDFESLDEGTKKQLKFLAPIAAQFEQKGKDENSPEVKKLKDKIKKILKGKPGLVVEEGARFEDHYPEVGQQEQQPQMGQDQPQMGQEQPGPGQQALMAILQKIQASRGML